MSSGILKKIITLFFLIIIIIIISGIYYYNYQKKIIKKNIYNELSNFAKENVSDINLWLKERNSDAEIAFNDISFKREVLSLIKNPNNAENKRLLKNWLLTINNNHDYSEIYIIDNNGKFLFSLSGSRKELTPKSLQSALLIIKKRKIEYSNLRKDPLTGKIYLDYIAPIFLKNGSKNYTLGAVIFRINPFLTFYPLVQSFPFPAKTGESYIIKRDSDFVTILSNLKYKTDAALNYRVKITNTDDPSVNAALGKVGVFEGNDYRGVPVLADIRKIPYSPWYLITKIDQSEIYEPISNLALIVLSVIILLIIIALISNYVVWKFQKSKAERQKLLDQLEKHALEKHFSYLTKYANDIIFLGNSDRNIIEANDAALKAYGYSKEEFLKLSVKNLRAPESWDEIERDFNKINKSSGITYETVHLRKNGERFPVEISARIIEIEGNKFYQNIIRDITERKKYQNNLERLNRVYAVLSNVNELIVRVHNKDLVLKEVCRIAVEYGKFRMVWIGLVDEQTQKVNAAASYGYTEDYLSKVDILLNDSERSKGPTGQCIIRNEHIICNDIAGKVEMQPWQKDAAKNNYLSSAAFPIKIESRVIGAITFYSSEKNFFNDEEIKLLDEMANDISFALNFIENEIQRKNAIETLIKNENQLSLIYSNVSDIIFFISVEGENDYRFISVNNSFTNAVGIPKELIEGKYVKEIIPESSLSLALMNYKKAINEKQTINWEEVTQYPAGLKYGIVSVTPIYNENGTCTNLIGTVQDITENKIAQEEIEKINRRYKSFFEEDLTGDYIALPSGKIITCNPSFIKMFGFTSLDEALNFNMYGLYKTRQNRDKLLENLGEHKKLIDYELEMQTITGSQLYIIENIIGKFDENDNLIEIKGYIINNTARKLVEIENRKLLRGIQQSPAIVIITDIEGRIEFVNDKFCEITGYTVAEVIGKNPRILSSGEKTKEEYAELWNTILSGKVWYGELHNKKKSGEYYWQYASISPVFDEKGTIINFIAVNEDITERKKVESALQKDEMILRTALDNLPIILYMIDNQGIFKLSVGAGLKALNLNENQVVGQSVYKIYKEYPNILNTIKRSLSGETVSFESNVGDAFFINYLVPFSLPYENFNGIIGIALDISQLKEAEEKIQMLAYAVKSVNECISITDVNNKILFVNETFLNTYGYREDELIGKNIGITQPEDISKDFGEKILSDTLREGWRGEFINKKKDGTLFPIYLSTAVIRNDENNPIALIGIATDISERKEAEKELIKSKEKAEEMNKLKTNFLNNMSHEMRTPLVAILGYAGFLLDEIQNVEHIEMIKSIVNGGNRLLDTINSILDLSKVESNKLDIKLTKVDIFSETQIVVNNLLVLAEQKNLYLKIIKKSENVFSLLDRKAFIQIVENLIGNAIKFTKSGGVTVVIDRIFLDNADWSLLKVIDTGIGIHKESLKIIFEEFRQASEGLNRSFEGNGLGLTITKKYVDLMDGKINVESEPGKGSTFTIMFKSESPEADNLPHNNLQNKI